MLLPYKNISLAAKLRLHKIIIRFDFTYDSELCTLKKTGEKKVLERKVLRKTFGIKRRRAYVRTSNAEIIGDRQYTLSNKSRKNQMSRSCITYSPRQKTTTKI